MMATTVETVPTIEELLGRLGGINPARVLARPAPGSAVETDVLEAKRRYGKLYELVDGVLVEKAMGLRESLLAGLILSLLRAFVDPINLGLVTGADGAVRLFPGLVRIPDVAFLSWQRLPGGVVPDEPIPGVVPDLAVEVLSASNTPGEMTRKLEEYFSAGVRLVWLVEPCDRTASIYTAAGFANGEAHVRLDSTQSLDGGDVLPGFTLPLSRLYAELDRHG